MRLTPRALLLALAVVTLALAFTLARPREVPGPALRDFEAYWAAGASWSSGDDPYSRQLWRAERTVPGVVATREELLPFIGPPYGLPLWAFFARFDYATASLLWRAVLGLAFVTLTLGGLELAGARPDWIDRLAVLALGAGFGPLTSGLALGQVAIVSAAAAVGTLLALRAKRTLLAAAAAFVAALQPNVGIALVARFGERRANVALVLAGALAVGGSIVAAGGAGAAIRYLTAVRDHREAELFLAIQTTPIAIARALGAAPLAAEIFGAVLAIGVVVVLIAQFASRRYDGVERFSMLSAALPLTWTFAHEHDFALALFPALVCFRRRDGWTWLAGAAGMLLVAIDWLGFSQRPSGVLQSALLALAAALATAALSRGRLTMLRFAPAATLVLIPIGAFISRAHPLAVWPNALPASFSVPIAMSAPQLWALEQHLSGIDTLDPWLGLLRALPLAGCALLWYSLSRRERSRSI